MKTADERYDEQDRSCRYCGYIFDTIEARKEHEAEIFDKEEVTAWTSTA